MNKKPIIVGIVNVTPDSYYDGGLHTADTVLSYVDKLVADGVDIIELGGESTGPGSKDISLEEETDRVFVVFKRIREAFPDTKISIDTYKAPIAQMAIDEGVYMINDIMAGRGDPNMFSVIAASQCLYTMMYSKDDTPRTTVAAVEYDDVIATIYDFLFQQKIAAMQDGIDSERIVVDPGMGHFLSSNASYSFEVIQSLENFTELGPVFVSPSRKSFLAGSENLSPQDRLPGTIAASVACALNGATYIRTHDVLDVRRACEIAMHLH